MRARAIEFGLSGAEYDRVLAVLGRKPSLTELGIFAVMWSEHCSYKSTRRWLKELPSAAEWVIQGPGENAGIVDVGDGLAVAFKMESHNHPSFIEPFQGAATGVGGIMRDVFTMGARPIANLNALRFGSPAHPRTRALLDRVVAGIAFYGNCMGVPTVGGELNFHPRYDGNILVNAMCVGLVRKERIFYARAAGVGNPVIYVGAKTGRDGIHGATMASQEFTVATEAKRPNVQIGDPFTEKLLLEACMELMEEDAIIAIQDMGAAGLTSSSVEMSARGGLGMALDLDQVPVRETDMSAYEIMLSESQERMLMVLKPEMEDKARAIFAKWELDYAAIGHLTDTGRLEISRHGRREADIPVGPLVDQAPLYERPYVLRAMPAPLAPVAGADIGAAFRTLMGSPDLVSRRWVWEQYDHLIGGATLVRPGGDAAVLALPDGHKALAVTCDSTPRYCAAHPKTGGAQAVAESWRNLCAMGARPLAFTDNLNFGNPERPEIMGEIVGAIRGMREAALALDYPVVSGNVSLYNETNGQAILPSPVIGGVGLIADWRTVPGQAQAGDLLFVLGATQGHLGASLYLREVEGREDGPPPPIDLGAERRHGTLVRDWIAASMVSSCHDVSDGGMLIAVAEMLLAAGQGAVLQMSETDIAPHAYWFGEDQARYVLAAAPRWRLDLEKAGCQCLGEIGGKELTLAGQMHISLEEMRQIHEEWLPRFMGEPHADAGQ
jgi:phosphoribosylformylglycinamidine synthase